MNKGIIVLLLLGCAACENAQRDNDAPAPVAVPRVDTVDFSNTVVASPDTATLAVNKLVVNTGKVQPAELIAFAESLIGTRYRYGSVNPELGFDCSGFISYVFNHFRIDVPRSSIDFTDVGRTVPADSARPGDLILFTGTDSTEQHVGHMGIIVSNNKGEVQFIHSTSGKAYGVTITPLNTYYRSRYVRTARIFPENQLG